MDIESVTSYACSLAEIMRPCLEQGISPEKAGIVRALRDALRLNSEAMSRGILGDLFPDPEDQFKTTVRLLKVLAEFEDGSFSPEVSSSLSSLVESAYKFVGMNAREVADFEVDELTSEQRLQAVIVSVIRAAVAANSAPEDHISGDGLEYDFLGLEGLRLTKKGRGRPPGSRGRTRAEPIGSRSAGGFDDDESGSESYAEVPRRRPYGNLTDETWAGVPKRKLPGSALQEEVHIETVSGFETSATSSSTFSRPSFLPPSRRVKPPVSLQPAEAEEDDP